MDLNLVLSYRKPAGVPHVQLLGLFKIVRLCTVVMVFMTFRVMCSSTSEALLHDCDTLQTLYESTGGPRWRVQTGWNGTRKGDCCDWYGVKCAVVDGTVRVVSISLDNNSLNGTLPSKLADLVAVLNISLSSNSGLHGTVPTEWSAWTMIYELDLGQNSLSGTLPTEWSVWTTIYKLGLSQNSLSGTLPTEWSAWTTISGLYLNQNFLSGTLPTAWSAWTQIYELNLNQNFLSGTLPTEWSAWTQMYELDLHHNFLSGTLPMEWSAWKMIGGLELDENYLNGTLPTEWSTWTTISGLFLSGNSLSGTLPTEWSVWTTISLLGLHQNSLSGTLPTEWSAWTNIGFLYLSKNSLTGTLPTEWSAWTKIHDLNIYQNSLSGPLPTEWSAWTIVYNLGLYQNSLSGTLPTEWGAWTTIVRLDLSQNSLNGTLPTEWNLWADLKSLQVSNNELVGSICICPHNLSLLGVRQNRFTKIDPCLARTMIISLNLEGNPIVHFPASLDNSTYLTVMDLRSTSLSLSLADLPRNEATVPVLQLSDNPGVTGRLEDFLGTPVLTTVISSYVELDLSNTSITGSLESIDPVLWTKENSDFPLSNLNFLAISHNRGIVGGLPMNWFQWVSDGSNRLVFNVENVTGLRAASLDDVMFDSTQPLQPYNGILSYLCKPLRWPPGITVNGIDPQYFNYTTCRCSSGYSGQPPHCANAVDTKAIVLGVLFGIASLVLLFLGGRKVRRWRIQAHDFRRAKQLLTGYAKQASKWTRDSGHSDVFEILTMGNVRGPLLNPSLSQDWLVRYEDVRVVKTVASGAQGRVSMALWNRTIVALKEFFTMTEEDQQELMGEASVHVQLHHPNVVQLLGVCLEPLCTITEWMERGSLFDIIADCPQTLPNVSKVALDIARGMLYLHSKGIVHRDLKSLNIMLDGHGTAKVGDFGLARRHDGGDLMTMGQGTVHWMAPEVFRSGHYSESCDVYSFGIILWELCMKERPFSDLPFTYQVQERVTAGDRPPVPSGPEVPPSLVSLMQRCWVAEPLQRPTFEEIVDELEADCRSNFN